MNSVFKNYISPNANDVDFDVVRTEAFNLNQDDFLYNISEVKSYINHNGSEHSIAKAQHLYTFLMSEVAQQFLGQQVSVPVRKTSYPLLDPTLMEVCFAAEDGYLPIAGGDRINHARASEQKLLIAHYCESEVTEYHYEKIESFKVAITSFEEFFKVEV